MLRRRKVEDATHQVADDNLALAGKTSTLRGRRLGSVASGLCVLLDTASGSSIGGLTASRAAASTAAGVGLTAALSGENLVERLVELSGHYGGGLLESDLEVVRKTRRVVKVASEIRKRGRAQMRSRAGEGRVGQKNDREVRLRLAGSARSREVEAEQESRCNGKGAATL